MSFNSLQVVQRCVHHLLQNARLVVSIPYRQSRDLSFLIPPCFWFLCFNSLQVVQRCNSGVSTPIILIVFQFLIGSLEMYQLSTGGPGDELFQFLIGSLEMLDVDHGNRNGLEFQFLIGSLEIHIHVVDISGDTGFNSLQVVQRSGNWQALLCSLTSFNSLQVVQRCTWSSSGRRPTPVSIPYRQSRD